MTRAYDITNDRTGEVREVFLNREQGDKPPAGWSFVVVQGVRAVCPRGEPSQRDSVLAGFKAVESKLGTSVLERGIGMKASKVKRVWDEP